VLTEALEAVYGLRIDSLLALRAFGPLGMTSTRFLPPASWLPRIAPTERDPWRGRVLRGEVHDENAARLGGVSGHAGLFSDAEDLLTFGEWLLKDGPSENSSAGTLFSPRSFGHTGFTGTSIWMDPTRHLVLVLLTNRVNPTRENNRHVALRKAVADATVGIVDAYSTKR
jgi:CubicO group peptidase (beta-lactamase class C family)